MNRCPSSAGRGQSASLAFGVAKALLAFPERHARTRAVRFPGHAPCQCVRGSGTVRRSVGCGVAPVVQCQSRLPITSCTKRHDSRPTGHPSSSYNEKTVATDLPYMTNERERADVHQWYVQHPRQRWRHGHVAPL
eukprot:scaffold18299_cov79-Phaeocystis_antarctica.AAC.1